MADARLSIHADCPIDLIFWEIAYLVHDNREDLGDIPILNIRNIDAIDFPNFLQKKIVIEFAMKVPKRRLVGEERPRDFKNSVDEMLLEIRVQINRF